MRTDPAALQGGQVLVCPEKRINIEQFLKPLLKSWGIFPHVWALSRQAE